MRAIVTVGLVLTAAGAAGAQGYNPAGQYGTPPGFTQPGQFFAPNYYNRANQPLNPYLNLVAPNNPAVNFYYRTRPGLPSGGAVPYATTPNYNPFAPRAAFAPYTEPLGAPPPANGDIPAAAVAPTGHPVGYGNLSNYGTVGGGGNRPGTGASRMAGVGATPRPPADPSTMK